MVTMRLRMDSFIENAVSSMPSGLKIRSFMTSPSRLPVIPSTTWPAQSMLEPYSHCSPGSNSSGVQIEACEAVMTLGCPWF